MKKFLLFSGLLVGGIITYFGLLVAPGRVTAGNLILFVIYLSAATFLLIRKKRDRNNDE
jgi:hypothetical protein